MFRVPIGLTVALFGLHSAATEDAAAGCYASYSSGGSYKKDSYASATFTEVTAMTTASCTVGTPGCGSNGFKTEGGKTVTKTHNFLCSSDVWCDSPGYEPGNSQYWGQVWEKLSECSGTAAITVAVAVPTEWSDGGCPKVYLGGTDYDAGDVVSVQKTGYKAVYSCNGGPSHQWCGMAGYEPSKGLSFSQAWTELGSCAGIMSPTDAPSFTFLEDAGGCPGTFDSGADYKEGNKINKDGFVYKCKGWPDSQHCSQAGYEPGVDVGGVEHWKLAWDIIGHCSGTIHPTSSPSFLFLEDMGGCPDAWRLKGASDPYEEGDMVSSNNLVFKCNAWPHSSHCGQSGYEPNVSPAIPDAWRVAWAIVGHCSGSIGPTTSPNSDSAKTVGACSDEWVGGGNPKYKEGAMVSVTVSNTPLRKVTFKCKAWPHSGNCGQFSPTQHGGNLGWSVIGSCDGTNSPTVAPSPYGGTCAYTKCAKKSNCIPGSTSNGNSGSSNCSCDTDDVRTSSCKQTVCKDVAIKPYSSSVSYDFGDVVRVGSKKFRCRGYPYGQWCQQKIYAPTLVAGIWSSAWTMDGTCPPEPDPIVIKTTTVTWTINPASLGVTIPFTLPTGSELTTLVNTLKAKIKAQIEAFSSLDQEVEDITIVSIGGTYVNLRRLKEFVVSTNNASRSLVAKKVKYRAEIKYSCLLRECDQIRSAVEETTKLGIETPTPPPTPPQTDFPSKKPTSKPTDAPTKEPTPMPSESPRSQPSSWPSSIPSAQPSMDPSVSRMPSGQPSENPSVSDWPTSQPSHMPSVSGRPSLVPSDGPSESPSSGPSSQPSSKPSEAPSITDWPTTMPSESPSISAAPSGLPSEIPSASDWPTSQPSSQPSAQPSMDPSVSTMPSGQPSVSDWPTSPPSVSGRPSLVPSASFAPSYLNYYTAWGSSRSGTTVEESDPLTPHEVRCCSNQFLTGWTLKEECTNVLGRDVWGESMLPECYYAETYANAKDICEIAGGRLCTIEELLADCTRGSGCGHDWDMIWAESVVVTP